MDELNGHSSAVYQIRYRPPWPIAVGRAATDVAPLPRPGQVLMLEWEGSVSALISSEQLYDFSEVLLSGG